MKTPYVYSSDSSTNVQSFIVFCPNNTKLFRYSAKLLGVIFLDTNLAYFAKPTKSSAHSPGFAGGYSVILTFPPQSNINFYASFTNALISYIMIVLFGLG